ncbi:hypothetical protein Peur_004607 [Populus x canadensis]
MGREPHPVRQSPSKAAVRQQAKATIRKEDIHSKQSAYRINQSTMSAKRGQAFGERASSKQAKKSFAAGHHTLPK